MPRMVPPRYHTAFLHTKINLEHTILTNIYTGGYSPSAQRLAAVLGRVVGPLAGDAVLRVQVILGAWLGLGLGLGLFSDLEGYSLTLTRHSLIL